MPALFPDKTLAPDTLYVQLTFFERVNPNAFKHLYGYCVCTCVDSHMYSCVCTVCTHVWRPEANLEGQFSVTVTLVVCSNYMHLFVKGASRSAHVGIRGELSGANSLLPACALLRLHDKHLFLLCAEDRLPHQPG